MHRRGSDRGSGRFARISPRPMPGSYTSSSSRGRFNIEEHHCSQSSSPSQEINLVSNSYCLETNANAPPIYEYQLSVALSEGYKDLPAKVLFRNFVSRSIRKLIMEKIVPKLIDPTIARRSVVIESHLEAIYSLRPFTMSSETSMASSSSSDFQTTSDGFITFKNLFVETDLLNLLRIDVNIKYLRQLDLTSSDQRYNLLTSVLHHQLSVNMLRFGSVYYKSHDDDKTTPRDDRLDLISQHIMGISLSGLRRSTNGHNLVVINCPHSYITNSHRLIDLLASFIAGRPIRDLQLSHSARDPHNMKLIPEIVTTQCTESWFSTFASILEGFKCRAEGPEEHINLRFHLTEESAENLLMDNTTLLTVRDYYRQLGVYLNYPNLPCLKSRSERHPYYPLEMCSLISGQKVPIFRLSSAARNELAFLNKPKPDSSKQLSCRARDEVANINSKQFQTFGISLCKDPVQAKGSTLPRPTLQYREREVEPQRDFWESGVFYQAMHLVRNWCVVNTVPIDSNQEERFFREFSSYCGRFGFNLEKPFFLYKAKDYLLEQNSSIENLINECQKITEGNLKFIMFVIDSSSTALNRLVHLSFDEHPSVTASCLRVESIMNHRQHRSIYRTLAHKLNTRLGGTNVVYNLNTLARLSLRCEDLMIIGLDVTHPDNELNGVSIVGCAYTYNKDLFRHRSLVWPQTARVEIITKMDLLMKQLVHEYYVENKKQLPKQIIVYRDGVSHEEFEKVRINEVLKAQAVLDEVCKNAEQPKPILSYIIAQKRHTMRFFHMTGNTVSNPPSGTLIDQDVVTRSGREFYLYSNTSPQATARPLHYHVLLNGLGIENLQKLTYFLCFNFGKCSGTLSMPSSLRYAHNAAYDARNRVIAAREFSENRFYTSKFFC